MVPLVLTRYQPASVRPGLVDANVGTRRHDSFQESRRELWPLGLCLRGHCQSIKWVCSVGSWYWVTRFEVAWEAGKPPILRYQSGLIRPLMHCEKITMLSEKSTAKLSRSSELAGCRARTSCKRKRIRGPLLPSILRCCLSRSDLWKNEQAKTTHNLGWKDVKLQHLSRDWKIATSLHNAGDHRRM